MAPFVAGNALTMNTAQLIGAGVTGIVLDTGGESDLVRVLGTPDAGVTTFTGVTSVLAGSADDSIDIGISSLNRIASPVDVDGGAGSDSLEVWDYNGTPDPLVTITNAALIGIAPADIFYTNVTDLRVDVADGAPATIAVESTLATTEILLDSGATETITFGDAGDLSGIQGTVLLTDVFGGGNDTIVYDDSAFAGGRTYTLLPDGGLQATGVAPINVLIAGGTYESVELYASSGNDIININPDTTTAFLVEGGGGADTFNVTGSPGAPTTVDLEGGTGNDTFNVVIQNGSTTVIDILGGSGTDTLDVTVTGTTDPTLEIIPTLGGADADLTFTGTQNLTFSEIEIVDVTGNLSELSIREDLSPDFIDGAQDTITLTQLTPHLRVDVDGVPQIRVEMASLSQVTVEGSTDPDRLVLDNAGGLINLDIEFNGNGPAVGPGDSLVIQGNAGPIARETYIVGATQDAGLVVLDPDDSAGPGAAGALSGDEQVITFTGLEPIDTSTPVGLFDVILTAGVDDVRIEDGGLLNGFNSIRVVDLNATFETFRFANKTMTRFNGVGDGDIFRVEYTTAAAGLTTLELYGHARPASLLRLTTMRKTVSRCTAPAPLPPLCSRRVVPT